MLCLNAPTVLVGSLLLAVSPIAETLEFTPKGECTVTRTLHMEKSSEVEKATIHIMGQEVDAGGGMLSTDTRDLKLVDAIGKVEDGRILDFVRTYEVVLDEGASEGAGEGIQVIEADGDASDLEGQEVSFTWDAEEEEYNSKYVGEDPGEDEWLEGLTVSLDLVDWLPASEVEEGAKWEVSLDELGALIWYGGRVYPIEGPGEVDKPEGGIAISVPKFSDVQMLEGTEGAAHLTLSRVEEKDDQRIAVVTIAVKGSVSQDMTEKLNELNDVKGLDLTYDSAEQDIDMLGAGELHWNLTTGRLASLTLNMEEEVENLAEWSIEASGQEMELSYEGTWSQTYRIELTEQQVDKEEE